MCLSLCLILGHMLHSRVSRFAFAHVSDVFLFFCALFWFHFIAVRISSHPSRVNCKTKSIGCIVLNRRHRATELEELLPGILPQLGADGLETLRKLASSFQGGAGLGGDDDVPELVENFEDASKK